MRELKIMDQFKKQWEGTQDNRDVLYAIETARTYGNRETVDQKWRWLSDDMQALYDTEEPIAVATCNYLKGWISGATDMLNKALSNLLNR